MPHLINFNPGPSQLYFTVEDHVKKAFRDGVPSLSHRSKTFEHIYADCKNGLQELLNIPATHQVLFTSSATEIWERILQSMVEQHSHHFVNGAFSKRFYEIATQLQKQPIKTEAQAGSNFSNFTIDAACELIALTHNETSAGFSLSQEFINNFKEKYPHALVAIDAVSSLPYPTFDFNKIDTIYFSVQKGFGLPAGLGVWIVNDRCIEKSEQLHGKGHSTGSYHSLSSLVEHSKKHQTPETPNVLGIYLLSKVIQDMLRRGIQQIRKETEYKAAILYQALQTSSHLKPFVKDPVHQSKTVIVAEAQNGVDNVYTELSKKGMLPGDGYGSFKKNHLRFANFPAHSKEQYELLVDTINELNF